MPLRLLRKLKRTNTLSTVSSASEPQELEVPNTTLHEAVESSPEPFLHEPLPEPREDIRLLRRRNGPSISFDLFYVKLSAAPPYIALSYCRDEQAANENGTQILLNGKAFSIADNLYQALRNDCVPTESCAWIDTICINHHDQDERCRQLKQIGSIFSKAAGTIAWIGADHSNEVGSLLQVAQDFPQTRQRYASESQWCMANAISITDNIPSTDAIQYLFKRPYWSHLWALQEIALSPNLAIQCGAFCASLSSIEAILKSIAFLPDGDSQDHPDIDKILRIRQLVQQKSNTLSLGNVLELSHPQPGMLDPRDQIYSILGLVMGPTPIEISGSTSIETILTTLTTHRLRTEGLDILGGSQPDDPSTLTSLPSWVSDLRKRRTRSYTDQFLLPLGVNGQLRPVASATDLSGLTGTRPSLAQGPSNTSCKDSHTYRAACSTESTIHFNDSEDQISVLGRRVSTVTTIANACSSATFGSNRVQAWLTKQYHAQRFKAASKWEAFMSADSQHDLNTTFWNEAGKSLYPTTDQEKKQLAWDQLMNPYAKYPEYWAFLDMSMGPSLRRMCHSGDHADCELPDESTDSDTFRRQVDFFDGARRAFQTSIPSQYGIGPGNVQPGDILVLFDGASVPHILRSVEGTENWRYLGEAYVKGIMHGEAAEQNTQSEFFTLV